jgi:hypothetical protein
MDGKAKIKTNTMTQNFSYFIDAYYVNTNNNDNNNIYIRVILKTEFRNN